MFHLDNETGVPVMPDLPPTQSNEAKWFTEGGNGVSPSWPGSTWFNIIQAEMLNVLAAAGITPDKENLSQLSEAITNLINSDSNTFLKVANNLSEIEDAGPAAVAAAWNHLGIGALLTGALQKANNLSEIKTAGPAAVAQTLLNLGLGDAAKLGVGKSANQIPDISYFLANLGFSGHQDVPSLDVAGNLGLRWGTLAAMTAGPGQTVTFTRPFSSNCVFAIAFLIRPGSTNTGTSETMYLVSKSATQATFSKGGSESYSAIYLALGY
ncbi:TPA: hypothetical protein ACPZCK_001058 [Yersinia enterocolitica]